MSDEALVDQVADAMWRTVNEPKLPGGVEVATSANSGMTTVCRYASGAGVSTWRGAVRRSLTSKTSHA